MTLMISAISVEEPWIFCIAATASATTPSERLASVWVSLTTEDARSALSAVSFTFSVSSVRAAELSSRLAAWVSVRRARLSAAPAMPSATLMIAREDAPTLAMARPSASTASLKFAAMAENSPGRFDSSSLASRLPLASWSSAWARSARAACCSRSVRSFSACAFWRPRRVRRDRRRSRSPCRGAPP